MQQTLADSLLLRVKAKRTAMYVLTEGRSKDITEGATHYHAWYVKPYWANSLQFLGTIGQHIYYR
jgi:spore germination cell wall hydrolase CwlJ-like protein